MPEQGDDPRLHVVSDFSNARDRPPFGILERPVVAMETRHDLALLTASRGDQHLRAPGRVVGQPLGLSIAEVEAHLPHRFEHLRVNPGSTIHSAEMARAFVPSARALNQAAAICERQRL